jgi:beta-glucanase (GH16 family)
MHAMRGSGYLFLVCAAFFLNVATANAGWQLTFSDEFDGQSIDRSKWKFSDFWGNRTLGGNAEKQCYFSKAVTQSGGYLHITATPGATPAADCKGAASDLQYISGLLSTSGCPWYEKSEECARLKPFAQSEGYFEMRAKLPKGKGFWPAFWLVPLEDGTPPEIDIMEALGHQPNTVYQTYHYLDAAKAHQKAGNVYNGQDFSTKFSTFGLDWHAGVLIWYIDGREVFRFASEAVSSKKMYLLLNLAVGGYWPGDPDATTSFPAEMLIDYVRVYKRVDDGRPDATPPGESSTKAN